MFYTLFSSSLGHTIKKKKDRNTIENISAITTLSKLECAQKNRQTQHVLGIESLSLMCASLKIFFIVAGCKRFTQTLASNSYL